MNVIRALCVLVITGVCALAQDAGPVVVVKESDAKIAKEAYQKYAAAKEQWEKAKAEIETKYQVVPADSPDAGVLIYDTLSTGTLATLSVDNDGLVKINSGGSNKAPEPEKPTRAYRKGFENGIQFTPDFRFAVPKPYEPQRTPFCGPIYGGGHNDYGGGITLTPGYALAN